MLVQKFNGDKKMKNKLKLLLLAVILSFCAINISAQEQRCVQPPSQMTAWFPFDENSGTTAANKISGGNTGSLMGSAAWLNPGKVANALNLPGNSYVRVANQPQLNFGRGDFSIDAWIRINQGGSSVRMIVDKRTSGIVGYLFFVYQNNKLGLQLGTGTYANYFSPNIPNLPDGNWHHVAVTVDRDSPTGARFYFDGNLNGTANPTAINGDLTNADPLRIGSELGTGNFLNGAIDEVELFNRVLTPEEIRTLFNAQGFGKCKEPASPAFNPCCPPINPNVVAESLVYKGSGSISAPYTLKLTTTAFNYQMQAYINYVNTVNPAINKIIVAWGLYDQGTGPVPMTFPASMGGTSPGNNGPILEMNWTTWTAGGSGNPAITGIANFFGTPTGPLANQFPMKINNWYRFQTGAFFNNNLKFFDKECAESEIFVRIQVLGMAKGVNPVLEISNRKGEIIGSKELKQKER